MEIELADLRAREMESIQVITKLKQEEDAAGIVGGSEESRTLSHERGMSEVSDNPDPSKYSHRRDRSRTI